MVNGDVVVDLFESPGYVYGTFSPMSRILKT